MITSLRKMDRALICKVILFVFLTIPGFSAAQQIVDGVAAVVEGEPILLSEIQQASEMQMYQLGISPETAQQYQRMLAQLQPQVLQSLIDQRIIQAKAEEDSIIVKEHEIEQSLEQQIDQMLNNPQIAGDQDKLEALLGMPMREIRNEYREQIRRQLLVERYQSQKFAEISVTRKEVENFYETYQDSIPDMPKRVNISHIFLNVRASSAADTAAVEQLREIKDMIEAGANFSELAAEYSQDPGSRQTGGDLGFVSRGSLVPEFEEVAFALEPGELSEIVKSDFGYHLIKLEERRGEKIHVRHILLTPEASESDVESVRNDLNALRTQVLEGASFDSLAQEASDDPDVTLNKGNLGWFEVPNLQLPEFQQVVDTMDVGEISRPFQTELGWHVIKLNDMRPAGAVTLEDNWAEIEQMVMQQKRAEEYQRWLENLRSQFYVDIKVEQITESL